MAGIFDFLDRMVNGQPVFDDKDQAGPKAHPSSDEKDSLESPPTPEAPTSLIRKHDDSSFPVVFVKQTKVHINGTKMQVYGWIQNDWPEEIMLDKIRLLDTTRELDSFLSARNGRELLLYDGPLLQSEHHEAQLDYKTQKGGDYFEAIHDVTFTFHPENKMYTVNELKLRLPIRDIYE